VSTPLAVGTEALPSLCPSRTSPSRRPPAPDGSIWVLLAGTRFYVWDYGVPLCNGLQPVLMRIKPGSPVFHHVTCIGGPSADAVIVRVDSSGRWLEYSLQYGGSRFDMGSSVAVDKDGNAFVAGYTGSADFWVIGTTVDRPGPGGDSDATLVSVDPVGRPRFSARFGGSGWDLSTHVLARPDGSLLVFGSTNSPEFGNPAEPPPSPSFSQLFVRTTDPLCTMLRCLPRRLLSPTR
jgi:hypothetical protein